MIEVSSIAATFEKR
jgi:hypothetical protein